MAEVLQICSLSRKKAQSCRRLCGKINNGKPQFSVLAPVRTYHYSLVRLSSRFGAHNKPSISPDGGLLPL